MPAKRPKLRDSSSSFRPWTSSLAPSLPAPDLLRHTSGTRAAVLCKGGSLVAHPRQTSTRPLPCCHCRAGSRCLSCFCFCLCVHPGLPTSRGLRPVTTPAHSGIRTTACIPSKSANTVPIQVSRHPGDYSSSPRLFKTYQHRELHFRPVYWPAIDPVISTACGAHSCTGFISGLKYPFDVSQNSGCKSDLTRLFPAMYAFLIVFTSLRLRSSIPLQASSSAPLPFD